MTVCFSTHKLNNSVNTSEHFTWVFSEGTQTPQTPAVGQGALRRPGIPCVGLVRLKGITHLWAPDLANLPRDGASWPRPLLPLKRNRPRGAHKRARPRLNQHRPSATCWSLLFLYFFFFFYFFSNITWPLDGHVRLSWIVCKLQSGLFVRSCRNC